MKILWCLSFVALASTLLTSARQINHPQLVANNYGRSHKQARVFPGVVAVKKLVLLKFKKIIPISLILFRSSNENEAELVPVYPTSEIPSEVQFIPTPNGISGHKDVEAIAIPNQFHQELELNGLTNVEGIETMLHQAEENENGETSLTVAETADNEDELLNVREDDEDQLLKKSAAAKPSRSWATENVKSPGKSQTSIEEIPIYLYSTSDNSHIIKHQIGARRYRQDH